MRQWMMPDRTDPRNVEVPPCPIAIGDYGMVVHIGLKRRLNDEAIPIRQANEVVHLALDRQEAERLHQVLGELLERVPPVYR